MNKTICLKAILMLMGASMMSECNASAWLSKGLFGDCCFESKKGQPSGVQGKWQPSWQGNWQSQSIIPAGYELQNVPGQGLCGYWSVLTALRILQDPNATKIYVDKCEVFGFLKELADYIRNSEDYELFNIIIAIYDDLNSFLSDLEQGKIQADDTIMSCIAKFLRVNICITSKESSQGSSQKYSINGSNSSSVQLIQLYHNSNGIFGHYQVIAPKIENAAHRTVYFLNNNEKAFCIYRGGMQLFK